MWEEWNGKEREVVGTFRKWHYQDTLGHKHTVWPCDWGQKALLFL